jgi:hypothetical protein
MGQPNPANVRQDRRVKHGMAGHPLYRTWEGMLARCERPSAAGYHNYGGRGIKVCEQWHDPRRFAADIERMLGPRPPGCTLDRYPDNDGDYKPGNVRWATKAEQAANRRPNPYTDGPVASARNRERWEDRPLRTEKCEQCGDDYGTRALAGSERLRFCSKTCKAKHRRDSGVDNVERTCHQCGGTFTANRYDKTQHCGQSCAATCQHAGGCPR